MSQPRPVLPQHAVTSPAQRDASPGLFNLQGLGRLPAGPGRRTRDRMIYRADSLQRMNAEDMRTLTSLGVRLVCDLRGEHELNAAPGRVPEGARYVHNPVLMELNVLADYQAPGLDRSRFALAHLYTSMLDTSGETFRRVFVHLADPLSYPYLFHCTLGKDRTGVTAALVLRASGVPDAAIVADFAASDARVLPELERFRPGLQARGWDLEQTEKLLRAPGAAMEATLRHLDTRYGSTEGYLSTIGVSPAETQALRTLFVEEVETDHTFCGST